MEQNLQSVPGLEIHHEYLTTIIQPLSAKYFMKMVSTDEAQSAIGEIFGSAVFWSSARVWADSSHKLTWLIEPIIREFPSAKFVNIVRDGRKVAGSFFRKLAHEIYEPDAISKLQQWLDNRSLPEPPPEKKYWWNVPPPSHPQAALFSKMDQFERCCFHWAEANRTASRDLELYVPSSQQFHAKLEDLVVSKELQVELSKFIGLDCLDQLVTGLKRPKHVLVPQDEVLTPNQLEQFIAICQDEMTKLGYNLNTPEYRVEY
jgi:hypothetical protein